jgi:hypothetical protein
MFFPAKTRRKHWQTVLGAVFLSLLLIIVVCVVFSVVF